MIRSLVAGLIGGFALFFTGFVFWGTPLARLAYGRIDDSSAGRLQMALAEILGPRGTGTYLVPDPTTPAGTALYGQGPVATVHFNRSGFPVMDGGALLSGLVLALVTGVLIALALQALAARGARLGEQVRTGVLIALAVTAYGYLGQPIFNHHGWGHFVYAFVSDLIGFALAILAAAWFLNRGSAKQR
jgi:hypothetical protein